MQAYSDQDWRSVPCLAGIGSNSINKQQGPRAADLLLRLWSAGRFYPCRLTARHRSGFATSATLDPAYRVWSHPSKAAAACCCKVSAFSSLNAKNRRHLFACENKWWHRKICFMNGFSRIRQGDFGHGPIPLSLSRWIDLQSIGLASARNGRFSQRATGNGQLPKSQTSWTFTCYISI